MRKQIPAAASVNASSRRAFSLLFLCAGKQLAGRDIARFRSLAGQFGEWNALRLLATRHGVVPLVYRNLAAHCPDLMPPAVLAQLRSEYLRYAAQSVALAAELEQILPLLESSNLRVLCYKGPVLAVSAYGQVCLRQCRDLDLLLPPSNIDAAIGLLTARGYRLQNPQIACVSQAQAEGGKDIALVGADGAFTIELHWAPCRPAFHFSMEFDGLWQRREVIQLGGVSAACPSHEDLFLLLCVHAASHCWASGKWLCDLAGLLRSRSGMQWDLLLSRSARLGVLRIVFCGLLLAHKLTGATLPHIVVQRALADRVLLALVRDIATGLLSPRDFSMARVRAVHYITSRERLRDRLLLAWEFCRPRLRPNRRDRQSLRLPRRLSAGYYLLRPFRVLLTEWAATVCPLLKSILR